MRGGGFGELLPLPFYRSIETENVLVLSHGVRDGCGLFGQAKMRADTWWPGHRGLSPFRAHLSTIRHGGSFKKRDRSYGWAWIGDVHDGSQLQVFLLSAAKLARRASIVPSSARIAPIFVVFKKGVFHLFSIPELYAFLGSFAPCV